MRTYYVTEGREILNRDGEPVGRKKPIVRTSPPGYSGRQYWVKVRAYSAEDARRTATERGGQRCDADTADQWRSVEGAWSRYGY